MKGRIVLALLLAAPAAFAKSARPDLDGAEVRAWQTEIRVDVGAGCRHPVAYESLRTAGRITGPTLEDLCPSFSIISERGERLTLVPKKLFEVQYLVAGRGGGFASRFGHAMLRLVFCAPDRGTRDESCRQDTFDAVDVGFAAHTDTQTFSVVGGVTGRYPSWLTITADPDLRRRYVDQEMRDLVAWPLKLDADARRMVLALILERHWAYDGRYKFLSNNCADEVLKVLQTSLPDAHPLVAKNPNVLRPMGLVPELIRSGLITEAPVRWSSRRQPLETGLNRLSLDPVARTVADYVKTPAIGRRSWILQNGRRNVALFTALEDVAQRDARARLTRASIDALYQDDGPPPECASTREGLREGLERDSAALSPARFRTDRGRGVPPPDDVASEDAVALRHAAFGQRLNAIYECFAHVPAVAAARAEVTTGLEINRQLQGLMFAR